MFSTKCGSGSLSFEYFDRSDSPGLLFRVRLLLHIGDQGREVIRYYASQASVDDLMVQVEKSRGCKEILEVKRYESATA